MSGGLSPLPLDRRALLARFAAVRARTEALAAPLSAEDQLLQAFPDASPTKWHRAHTTWFFETFVLLPTGAAPFDPTFGHLFNSYYDTIGARHPRPQRGLLSRPSAGEIGVYRRAVDHAVLPLLERVDDRALAALAPVVELGCAHEEQHQELILTDILAALQVHPAGPPLRPVPPSLHAGAPPHARPLAQSFVEHAGGLVEIGHAGASFAFDNEGPRHRVWLEPFALSNRLVTVGEVRAFVRDGGYRAPALWLSAGHQWAQQHGVAHPGHTRVDGDAWEVFGADGWRVPHDDEPALHLSYYEADAIARWLGARLPTEAEWEHATRDADPTRGNLLHDDPWQSPLRPRGGHDPFGDAWVWTRSAYAPYPGFAPVTGALGEYNGKFMIGQMVLRGGSPFTPRGHMRASYRNFWPPDTRFQASGIRLAREVLR